MMGECEYPAGAHGHKLVKRCGGKPTSGTGSELRIRHALSSTTHS